MLKFLISTRVKLHRIKKIKNGDLKVIKGDITNRNLVKKIFKDFNVENVIHFAGLKAVRESDFYPIKYYENNVMGSFILFEEMESPILMIEDSHINVPELIKSIDPFLRSGDYLIIEDTLDQKKFSQRVIRLLFQYLHEGTL